MICYVSRVEVGGNCMTIYATIRPASGIEMWLAEEPDLYGPEDGEPV